MQKLSRTFRARPWAAGFALAALFSHFSTTAATLRPPSVPLVACDPYFSIWSPADKLTGTNTTHWTGKPHRLTSLVRIDGKAYRVMGTEPQGLAPLTQTELAVLPTRTIYKFDEAGVTLTLTFMTAALPDDLELLSRPVTYLIYNCKATDGKTHEVSLYFDASAEIAVNEARQVVEWSSQRTNALDLLKVGSKEQPILAKKGDDLRIDWGYFYVAAPLEEHASCEMVPPARARDDFASKGALAASYDMMTSLAEARSASVGAVIIGMGKVSSQPISRWLMLAYDDLYAIQYFKQNLRPYWRRHGAEATDLLKMAATDYEALVARCATFDE